MWDEQNRARLHSLRERDLALGDPERKELARLEAELYAAEQACLVPAMHRLQQQRAAIELHNRDLAKLATRKQALVARRQQFLTETQAERGEIDRELAAVLSDGR